MHTRRSLVTIGVIATCLAALTFAAAAQVPACASRPEFGRLDFWVGEWRVLVGEQQVGTNRISRVLEGCAVTEEWTSECPPSRQRRFGDVRRSFSGGGESEGRSPSEKEGVSGWGSTDIWVSSNCW